MRLELTTFTLTTGLPRDRNTLKKQGVTNQEEVAAHRNAHRDSTGGELVQIEPPEVNFEDRQVILRSLDHDLESRNPTFAPERPVLVTEHSLEGLDLQRGPGPIVAARAICRQVADVLRADVWGDQLRGADQHQPWKGRTARHPPVEPLQGSGGLREITTQDGAAAPLTLSYVVKRLRRSLRKRGRQRGRWRRPPPRCGGSHVVSWFRAPLCPGAGPWFRPAPGCMMREGARQVNSSARLGWRGETLSADRHGRSLAVESFPGPAATGTMSGTLAVSATPTTTETDDVFGAE